MYGVHQVRIASVFVSSKPVRAYIKYILYNNMKKFFLVCPAAFFDKCEKIMESLNCHEIESGSALNGLYYIFVSCR